MSIKEFNCNNCGRNKSRTDHCKTCVTHVSYNTKEVIVSKPSYWIPIDDPNKNIMSHDTFKNLLEELDGNSVSTLAEKNASYSSNGDALHNFRSGGDILGGTPAQACWGYMTKHLTALRDMVDKNDFSNREDLLEKCQDTINYIRFLWCIGNDENNKLEKENK